MIIDRVTVTRDGWGWYATLHACGGLLTADGPWRPTRRAAIRSAMRAKRNIDRHDADLAAIEQVWP